MELAILGIMLAAVSIGGLLVLSTTALVGFLCFKLKRDATEPFFNTARHHGEAFVVDEMLDKDVPGNTGIRRPVWGQPAPMEPDLAATIMDEQTSKFLQQLAEDKAKEKVQ